MVGHRQNNLTERQIEILRCIGQGCNIDQAARSIGISPGNTRIQLGYIRDKLLAPDSTTPQQLVQLARDAGYDL